MQVTWVIVDIFLVLSQRPLSWISWHRSLWHDAHHHELGVTVMHSLQVLLLQTLGMEERIMLTTAGTPARSERLVKIVWGPEYIFGASLRCDSTNVTAESLFEVSLLKFMFLAQLTVVFMIAVAALFFTCFLHGWLGAVLLDRFGHAMGVSD